MKSLLVIALLISFNCNNFGQDSKLLRDDILYNLEHRSIEYYPDNLWYKTIEEAFEYIKTDDSLMFSKTLTFTLESNIKIYNHMTLLWENLLLTRTELFLSLATDKSEEDKLWLIHLAWLNSETITNFEIEGLINKLELLKLSADQNIASLAKMYLERYEEEKSKKVWY